MSVAFYNNSGVMWGIDSHKYIAVGEIEVPVSPYFVSIPFQWAPCVIPKRINNVTNGGFPLLQGGIDFYFVPHVPLPLVPPGAGEVAQLVLIHLNASSKAFMNIHSVHVGGDKAATCINGSWGVNQNCADPIDLLSGNFVYVSSSAFTQPSVGDYVGAYAALVLDAAIGCAIGVGLEKGAKGIEKKVPEGVDSLLESLIKHVWRRAPDIESSTTDHEVPKTIVDLPGETNKAVQQMVDGETGAAK